MQDSGMQNSGMQEPETEAAVRRRRLDAQASSAHDFMLALMDFAAAQGSSPCAAAAALTDAPTCQTCGRTQRSCVLGLYVRGLREDFDDETEIERLRGQGCQVQVVEAARLEVAAPALLRALRRAVASQD